MEFLIALTLALLALFTISLKRTYGEVPAKELKRRARGGDELAATLYKAASYGHTLRAVLWFLIGLSTAGFFVYVARILPAWQALLASGLLIWGGFVWLSAGKATAIGRKAAGYAAPLLGKLMSYLHRPIDWAEHNIRNFRQLPDHTGMYEKADLLDLLDRQQAQSDNRIERAELEIMHNTLVFGDKLVLDVMTPRRVVKMVSIDDDLGPIVMDELHKSGHSRFPVYEGNEDNIVGMLFLRDLVRRRAGGKIKNIMKKQVLYLHEEQSLYDALQAILKTHQHLFIVVNSFEEYVGVITIEDVLEQIIGEPIVDEFDEYEDMRAVAAVTAQKEHEKNIAKENEVSTEPEPERKPPEPDETIEV